MRSDHSHFNSKWLNSWFCEHSVDTRFLSPTWPWLSAKYWKIRPLKWSCFFVPPVLLLSFNIGLKIADYDVIKIHQFWCYDYWKSVKGLFNQIYPHSPILAKSIRPKDRTWKSLIAQASLWCLDPCSSGLDLQEINFFSPSIKVGTTVKK